MKLPRWAHRLYANLLGYFWLPCPICGRNFGGHERNFGTLRHTVSMGEMVCSECRTKADERNGAAFPDRWTEADEDDARFLGDVTNKIMQRDLLAKQAVVCDEPLREAFIRCVKCPVEAWGHGHDSDAAIHSCATQALYEGWMLEGEKLLCPTCAQKIVSKSQDSC